HTAPAERLLFLGMSPTIASIVSHLEVHTELGLAATGYLDDGCSFPAPASLPRLGTVANLDEAVETAQPVGIVIGRRETIRPGWADEFLELHFGGIQTEEAATLYERVFGRVCVTEVRPRDLVFGDAYEP